MIVLLQLFYFFLMLFFLLRATVEMERKYYALSTMDWIMAIVLSVLLHYCGGSK